MRSEIDYACLTHKEFAAKAGIKKRALDAYLGMQQSMPPADAAVKMAAALGLSVEYLVTGKEYQRSVDISKYIEFRDLLDDLLVLPGEFADLIKVMIKAAANSARQKAGTAMQINAISDLPTN